ncbi:hypothetical protein FB45DRAFT_876627 [Roridomyces roridus]|uniref:Uncharacterized protein n=1 Tax=Roridomyces roridus TaxID=1738132 RepID=A0AAD7B3N0_9AGAR|nr:hypothetical protein FB45DRAFT_876627 [Roridomyces roridus]
MGGDIGDGCGSQLTVETVKYGSQQGADIWANDLGRGGAAAQVRLVPWMYQGGRTSACTHKISRVRKDIGPWGRTYCFRVRHWFDSKSGLHHQAHDLPPRRAIRARLTPYLLPTTLLRMTPVLPASYSPPQNDARRQRSAHSRTWLKRQGPVASRPGRGAGYSGAEALEGGWIELDCVPAFGLFRTRSQIGACVLEVPFPRNPVRTLDATNIQLDVAVFPGQISVYVRPGLLLAPISMYRPGWLEMDKLSTGQCLFVRSSPTRRDKFQVITGSCQVPFPPKPIGQPWASALEFR